MLLELSAIAQTVVEQAQVLLLLLLESLHQCESRWDREKSLLIHWSMENQLRCYCWRETTDLSSVPLNPIVDVQATESMADGLECASKRIYRAIPDAHASSLFSCK